MNPEAYLRDVREGDCKECKKPLEFVETYRDDRGSYDGVFRCVNKECKDFGNLTLDYLEEV